MKQYRVEVIDRTYAAILAAKTPAERAAMVDAAQRTACQILRNRIQQLYPNWTEEERHHEYLRRLLGDGANKYLATRS